MLQHIDWGDNLGVMLKHNLRDYGQAIVGLFVSTRRLLIP